VNRTTVSLPATLATVAYVVVGVEGGADVRPKAWSCDGGVEKKELRRE